jgi:hypothetical protein
MTSPPSPFTTGASQEAAALVRAIRRVYGSPDGIAGVEKFTVHNVHDFAERLVAAGVRAHAVEDV